MSKCCFVSGFDVMTYGHCVSAGEVMAALRDTGSLNNTVVLFTSDHGDLAMEHRQFYKMSMFEGSSHVPLLIMGPGVKSGFEISLPVSLVDIYPTVLGKGGINSSISIIYCYICDFFSNDGFPY